MRTCPHSLKVQMKRIQQGLHRQSENVSSLACSSVRSGRNSRSCSGGNAASVLTNGVFADSERRGAAVGVDAVLRGGDEGLAEVAAGVLRQLLASGSLLSKSMDSSVSSYPALLSLTSSSSSCAPRLELVGDKRSRTCHGRRIWGLEPY